MLVREITTEERKKFNQAVNHPCQSWEWGEFRQQMGHRVFRIGVFDQQKLASAYQFSLHQLPRLFGGQAYTVGYLPRGPLPDKKMLPALEKIGREQKTIFFRIEPNASFDNLTAQRLKSLNLRPASRPFFYQDTFLIDLTKSETELLALMKPKTRYNLKLSQRHGVKVNEDNSDQVFNEYLRLLKETTQRQGFFAHTEKYHQQMWQTLRPAGLARLLKAEYRGQTLAVWILFKWQDILYYPYGASSDWYRHLMANNLLMWQAIRLGKKLGCQTFDLWGCLGEKPNPKHPWYGFHRFKEGYGGQLVKLIGSFDLVLQPELYRLYNFAENLRWRALQIKSRLYLLRDQRRLDAKDDSEERDRSPANCLLKPRIFRSPDKRIENRWAGSGKLGRKEKGPEKRAGGKNRSADSCGWL